MRARRLLLMVLLGILLAPYPSGLRARQAPPTLGLTLNGTSILPGQRLVAGVTVSNPGGGAAADFVFAVVLPDGVTVVSAGPGIGARFGRLSDLRTVVPVARNIGLAAAFNYEDPAFFAYDFTGSEPLGVYRFILAAVTAGALGDGALGPGELLAMQTAEVTVSASSVVVDPTRTTTVTVTPTGGIVETTAANGTVLSLTVPPGSVRTPTDISITPLIAFGDAPTGRLVAGIRAEPSGMFFDPPLTLTMTLPPGFEPPAFGVSGLIADDNGQHAQAVSARLAGDVVTMQVPHFSLAAVTLTDDWLSECRTPMSYQHTVACELLQPLYDEEVARIAAEGGGIGSAFRDDVLPILDLWMGLGILPRLVEAQQPGAPDPQEMRLQSLGELATWMWVYEPVFGAINDRANGDAGLPLGALIDQAQSEARLTFIAGMNASNLRCLADKPQVSEYVSDITSLLAFWLFGAPPDAERPAVNYCVDLHIDAAAPPVLTSGQPSLMPVDVRMRFTDGTELPGVEVSLAITASSATVSPAGGIVPMPFAGNVTVTPTGSTSTVTITAAVVGAPPFESLEFLPARTRTFQAGQPGTVDEGVRYVELRLSSSTRVQQASDNSPPIQPTASFTTNPALEPEVGEASYTLSGPIAGPLVDPDDPLIVETSLAVQKPAVTGLAVAEHTVAVTVTQRVGFELQMDFTCNGSVDDCAYTALSITGPGFNINEPARNISRPWSGIMEPGTYMFTARARTAYSAGAASASTGVTWTIRAYPPPE